MEMHKRILITGITGFIGSKLYKQLSDDGYEVWGISRNETSDKRIIKGDLNSYESTCQALSKIPDCSQVIHAAAMTHSKRENCHISYLSVNTNITKNIVLALEGKQPVFIHLSSVAVYGEDGRCGTVSVDSGLKPCSEYGLSKVMCEEILIKSSIKKYYFLRLAPVFDKSHLVNIKKRVYFPFQSKIRIKIIPSPKYSFCHINTLTHLIKQVIENANKQTIMNVADSHLYKQDELLKNFDGIAIPCPVMFLTPLYYLSFLFTYKYGYAFRCFYCKLFKSILYK